MGVWRARRGSCGGSCGWSWGMGRLAAAYEGVCVAHQQHMPRGEATPAPIEYAAQARAQAEGSGGPASSRNQWQSGAINRKWRACQQS